MNISLQQKLNSENSLAIVAQKSDDLSKYLQNKEAEKYLQTKIEQEAQLISINEYNRKVYFILVNADDDKNDILEFLRKKGASLSNMLNKDKVSKVQVTASNDDAEFVAALSEGIALSNYQFLKYFADKEKKENTLDSIAIISQSLSAEKANELEIVCKACYKARNFINEPLSFMTAVQLSEEIKSMAAEADFTVKVFNKAEIEKEKMGGLLAVNRGSIDPPTFSILEWKPKNAINKKPIVLVGKGVVFDTGGLSLKPTKNSMDYMKSDMSGAAVVSTTLYAIAKAKLPVHVITLVPATDNRPDGNAYAPGDIIHMHDGSTVEVLNTDAEGRMILADALSYAKRYEPQLVVNVATLTGAAAAITGKHAVIAMGNADEEKFATLIESGSYTHERIAQLPFWDDFKDLLKSNVADLKNIGGPTGGAITAGKFLEHFTDYPFIHLDIAGISFAHTKQSYRGKGGTGVGVRLLFNFIKSISKE